MQKKNKMRKIHHRHRRLLLHLTMSFHGCHMARHSEYINQKNFVTKLCHYTLNRPSLNHLQDRYVYFVQKKRLFFMFAFLFVRATSILLLFFLSFFGSFLSHTSLSLSLSLRCVSYWLNLKQTPHITALYLRIHQAFIWSWRWCILSSKFSSEW